MNLFTEQDLRDLDVELKVGLLATVNPQGEPHLTMLSSLRPYAADKLVWGQFIEGVSKAYILENSKTGYLIMSLQKEVWTGKAKFTHKEKDGPELAHYNDQPMFRYNAYFGIHTAYYMDVVHANGRQPLPMGAVVFSAIKTTLARLLSPKQKEPQVLKPWAQGLFNKLDNLKFISYVDTDGYPVVLPVIQTQALGSNRIIFAAGAYTEALQTLPAGTRLAVYAMSFDMETVLVRGNFAGFRRLAGMRCGVLDVDWVYNAMPPNPQQIYPPLKVEAVRDF